MLFAMLFTVLLLPSKLYAASESGSVGLQGTISSPPPKQGASINVPANNQNFNQLPITVSGSCPNGLLVKIFKNNIFSGAVQCVNGNYSISIDLFDGRNELIARVFDELDQAGPDSNTVVVNFADTTPDISTRVSLTSPFAKRGAAPGTPLTWPIIISGGTGPYAVSIDWGDKKAPDLLSRPFPGEFTAQHVYDQAGVYNIIVKVTDKNGVTAFLQLVGVGNGTIAQQTGTGQGGNGGSGGNAAGNGAGALNTSATNTIVLWWPVLLLVPFTFVAFWLGHRHLMHTIRKKIIQGERPF